jgi:hypothetical protein
MAPVTYRAFGLALRADRAIGGLPQAGDAPHPSAELRVWFEKRPPIADLSSDTGRLWYVSPYLDNDGHPLVSGWELDDGRYLVFRYTDGAEFTFDRQGHNIWVRWSDPLTFDDAVSYLLGPMMGLALRLRGVVCLHASAVSIDDGIIALIGQEGAGKSTTATAFAEHGYRVASDDVVPLFESAAGGWHAHPAYPRLRLWPSSVDLLANMSARFPRLPDDWGIRRYYVDFDQHAYSFETRSLPLTAIYLLDRRTDDPRGPIVDAVSAQERLMTLVANTFAARALDPAMRAREFADLARLVEHVPVRRVKAHVDPARLPALCNAIVHDVQQLVAQHAS